MITKLVLTLIVGFIPLFCIVGWVIFQRRRRDARLKMPLDPDIPRPAGFSLQRRIEGINERVDENLMQILLLSMIGVALYLFQQGSRWLHGMVIIVACLPFLFFGTRRLLRSIKQLQNCKLGLLGEQAVAGKLIELTGKGSHVFHDFVIEDRKDQPWNIDHIVVNFHGVFCIETKARRKLKSVEDEATKGWQVTFDGEQLHFPSGRDRHGLEQVERNAQWLQKFIKDAAAETVTVHPVLVLPGWYVSRKGRGRVWVLNEKELAGNLSTGKVQLEPQQIQRINYQLRQKCRLPLD